jgi:DegV family protein with EDD domain
VVDAGALGMFIFFDGFLRILDGREPRFRAITESFKDQLEIAGTWEGEGYGARCCIDAVIDVNGLDPASEGQLAELGHSVVTMRHSRYVKVHIHADDEEDVRDRISKMGKVVSWAADDLMDQMRKFVVSRAEPAIHVMTDAAGSVTCDDAAILGFTLLDSYVNIGARSYPETHLDRDDLYRAMREGEKVSTAQASDFEKHQHYEKVLSLHERVLYLCVGSVFTGNYQTVMEWKREHDPQDRMVVIDTGAASGRLGLIALATALHAHIDTDAQTVVDFATGAVQSCREYIFLDKLHFLAAGGRLSKTSAFFGDLLKMKPVVSPTPEGAKKVAVLRNQTDQLRFALERLDQEVKTEAPFVIMLEFTDNEEWVRLVVGDEIQRRFPKGEILFQPFSFTSGAHMGPGIWGLSFLPESDGLGSLIERSRKLADRSK